MYNLKQLSKWNMNLVVVNYSLVASSKGNIVNQKVSKHQLMMLFSPEGICRFTGDPILRNKCKECNQC